MQRPVLFGYDGAHHGLYIRDNLCAGRDKSGVCDGGEHDRAAAQPARALYLDRRLRGGVPLRAGHAHAVGIGENGARTAGSKSNFGNMSNIAFKLFTVDTNE
jgi:hypothetical protein